MFFRTDVPALCLLRSQDLSDYEQRSTTDQLSQASQQLTETKAEALKLQLESSKLQETLGKEQQLRQSAEQEIAELKERLSEMEVEARRAVEGELVSPRQAAVQLGKRRRHNRSTPVDEGSCTAAAGCGDAVWGERFAGIFGLTFMCAASVTQTVRKVMLKRFGVWGVWLLTQWPSGHAESVT